MRGFDSVKGQQALTCKDNYSVVELDTAMPLRADLGMEGTVGDASNDRAVTTHNNNAAVPPVQHEARYVLLRHIGQLLAEDVFERDQPAHHFQCRWPILLATWHPVLAACDCRHERLSVGKKDVAERLYPSGYKGEYRPKGKDQTQHIRGGDWNTTLRCSPGGNSVREAPYQMVSLAVVGNIQEAQLALCLLLLEVLLPQHCCTARRAEGQRLSLCGSRGRRLDGRTSRSHRVARLWVEAVLRWPGLDNRQAPLSVRNLGHQSCTWVKSHTGVARAASGPASPTSSSR